MLRHKFGAFDLGRVDRSCEPTKILPRLPPPVCVQYRRNGDISNIVEAVKKYPRIRLSGAVGAGKSTVVPMELADALGTLVVHTVPAVNSAHYLADYLIQLKGGEKFTYMDDPTADLPQRGIVLMSNTYFIARMFQDGFGAVRNFVLFLDEDHEDDGPTSVLRQAGTDFSCVTCVVYTSATGDPAMDLKPHLPSNRTEVTYKWALPKEWSAYDKDKPWSITSCNYNTVIVMDRATTVARLLGEYREAGFIAYSLTSRTSYEDFCNAMYACKNDRGPVVILIVDYSHRSSLTFAGARRFIESGEVGLASIVDNAPGYIYREVYEPEVTQFFGRGARVAGQDVTLYRPDKRFKKRMCDVDALEGDAANLMFRMLGYRPPIDNAIFGEMSGPVPIDLVAALQGDTPLKLYPAESREPWVKTDVEPPIQSVKACKPFVFESTRGVRPRPASCRTVVEQVENRTPSPPLNMLSNITEIDSDAYSNYAQHVRDSPPLSPIRSLSSKSVDNLSIYDDLDNPPYAKPKRIAQRVLDARAAEQKQLPAVPLDATDDGIVASDALELADRVIQVKQTAGSAFEDLARSATQIQDKARKQTFAEHTDQARAVRNLLSNTSRGANTVTIDDINVGSYYYYHGMDKAPDQSGFFIAGYDSIVQFCTNLRDNARTSVLPERDKLYAMRVILDKYNTSTARVYGIQRLMHEIHNRSKDQFEDLLDPVAFNETLQWALGQINNARADVLLARKFIPLFANCPLDELQDLHHLENSVMREVIEKFEYAAVIKDPDKKNEYFNRLNSKKVRIMQSVQKRTGNG